MPTIITEETIKSLGIPLGDHYSNFLKEKYYCFVPNGKIIELSHNGQNLFLKELDQKENLLLFLDKNMLYSNKLKLKDFFLFYSRHMEKIKDFIPYDFKYIVNKAFRNSYKHKKETGQEIDYFLLSYRVEKNQVNNIKNEIEGFVLSGISNKRMLCGKSFLDKERYGLDLIFIEDVFNIPFLIDLKKTIFDTSSLVSVNFPFMGIENNLESCVNESSRQYLDMKLNLSIADITLIIFNSFCGSWNEQEKEDMIKKLSREGAFINHF